MTNCSVYRFAICLALLALVSEVSADSNKDKLPEYQPAKITTDSLTSVGSDSMDGLVRLWVEEYKKYQPELKMQVVSRGSATAPAALIEGSADLGPMNRPMKSSERDKFISTYGFEPTQVRTAFSAVAVYVAKSNPIKEISFQQLDEIFSEQTAGSAEKDWSSLNIKLPGQQQSSDAKKLDSQKIVALGLDADPYLGAFFKQSVLAQKPFRTTLLSTQDTQSLQQALELNPGGIGFGALVTKPNDGVKIIAVRKDAKDKAVTPTEANITSEKYPLARALSIYVVREPAKGVEPALLDFLKFVLSVQGQRIVREQGLIPLPARLVREELEKLQ